jgi:hypothetical protein
MKIIGPYQLTDNAKPPRTQGLYIIGSVFDETKPIQAVFYDDPYSEWCPVNFSPRYAGISLSRSSGIRGRLSSHARKKGNKKIASLIEQKIELWFVCLEGENKAIWEAILLCLKTPTQFDCNVRGENERSSAREHRKIRDAMSPQEREFYDHLDMGPHGNGM